MRPGPPGDAGQNDLFKRRLDQIVDEALCVCWIENPYYQLLCGEAHFRHALAFDCSSMTRWRQRMGEERLVALLQESLATATRTGAPAPADFAKAVIDASVQPKAVAYPTDGRLMHRGRQRLATDRRRLAPILCESVRGR